MLIHGYIFFFHSLSLLATTIILIDEFVIISRRHHGMPFGLSLFVDGMIYCRLSSCCEYKHKPGHMIGGRSGHFRLVMIEGGRQCYKCESKAATSVSKRRGDLFELVTSNVSTTKQENNQETQHENEVYMYIYIYIYIYNIICM